MWLGRCLTGVSRVGSVMLRACFVARLTLSQKCIRLNAKEPSHLNDRPKKEWVKASLPKQTARI